MNGWIPQQRCATCRALAAFLRISTCNLQARQLIFVHVSPEPPPSTRRRRLVPAPKVRPPRPFASLRNTATLHMPSAPAPLKNVPLRLRCKTTLTRHSDPLDRDLFSLPLRVSAAGSSGAAITSALCIHGVVKPSSCVLQASDILRRIERFLNTDNDPDADTFLLCYSALGSSDGGKWCCDDATYVTFEQVVDLWQVGSRSRCAGAASLATVSRLPAEQRRAEGRPSSDCLRRRLLQRPLGAEGAAAVPARRHRANGML